MIGSATRFGVSACLRMGVCAHLEESDAVVMNDKLYVPSDFPQGIHVYNLNGAALPTYSHAIPLPASVSIANDSTLDGLNGRPSVAAATGLPLLRANCRPPPIA